MTDNEIIKALECCIECETMGDWKQVIALAILERVAR